MTACWQPLTGKNYGSVQALFTLKDKECYEAPLYRVQSDSDAFVTIKISKLDYSYFLMQ